MEHDFDIRGSDRRTFLRAMVAAGAIGAADPVGAVAAQEDEPDDYHQSLQSDLRNEYGLPAGQFTYGTAEQDKIDTFALQGQGQGSETQISVDADVPITLGDRVEVGEDPTNAYDYTYQGFLEGDTLSQGDVMLAVAYVRSDSGSAETQAQFKYRYTDSDGNTAFQSGSYVQESATVAPSGEWTRYFFPIEVGEKPEGTDLTPYLEFWVGQAQQTVEFGGIALFDYSDTDIAVGDLPAGAPGQRNPLLDYEGREEGAQWRQDARDRIEEIRKTDVEVTVVDGNGDPVPDATVDLAMTEHVFDFGSAVATNRINGDGEDDATYREVFLENFNKAVIENALKYPAFLGPWGDNKDDADQTLEWLNERDVPTRGHYLMWEEYGTDGGGGMSVDNPDSLTDQELQQLLVERIQNHASDVGDRVVSWDMHNHPIWQPNFRSDDGRGLGWDAVLEWWDAGDGATEQPLYTNEMGNVAGDFFRSQHLDFVQRLVEDDAPIDGIGFMGHVQFPNGNVTPPAEMLSTYDDFADTGLPILITEFDVQIGNRSNADQVAWQADFVRDFMIATFSHEAVEGLMSWGFWAGEHWRPTGAYFNEDWTLRPHGEEFVRLVFEEWWTDERGTADDSGVYATRAFEGDYVITASDGERAGETTATFADDGTATVQISPASIADVDLEVPSHHLEAGETTTIDVTVTSEAGDELVVPTDAITFESDNPDAIMVDEVGSVTVAGTGTATVSVTVDGYGDTAATSAAFSAFGEPAIDDQAEDQSLVESSPGVHVTNFEQRHGDGARFEKDEAGATGSLTYRVDDGVAAVRTDVYVNFQEIDGDGDVYEGLVFEVSSDGDSYEEVAVEPETVEAASDANGFWAYRRYEVTEGLPDDAEYLRVTITETEANWAVNVGSIQLWSATANLTGEDLTGPTILLDGVQAGETYEAPHDVGVTIVDDESSVAEQSVTLNGDDWTGGTLTARGRNLIEATATNPSDVTTATSVAVTVVDEDHELNARLQPNMTEGVVGDRFTFQVRDTTGNQTWLSSFDWDFDDGESASGWWNDHRYDEPGAYTVTLDATDNTGETTTDAVVLWVSELQETLARAVPSTTEASVGERIEFRVEDTTGQGRWIDGLSWEFGDGTTAEGWWAAHEYDEAGTYTVVLTATDNMGFSTTHEVEITVE